MPVEENIRFATSDTTIRGRLLLPQERNPLPAVILCTGFSGTQDTPSIRAAAQAFVDAGLAVLTFDYRSFGISDGTPRQVIDIAGQLADIRSAMDYVGADPRLDSSRIVLWGTSLGGGHAVVASACRFDVAAVIAQVPFNGFPRTVRGRSSRTTRRLLLAMTRDRLRGMLGRPPAYIPAVGPRDTIAVMASDAAEQTIASLDSPTWRNQAAPRVLFSMMRYHPADSAPFVHAPLLVCAAAGDQEAPVELVSELAARAPRGRQVTYPVSHFEVYSPDTRDRLLRDQVDFLTGVLSQ
ncbi:alpha/beta hydrolase [Mycetocola manganoxydans]|nr:alpha/beta hydrolase [Mycetocola manganoxydans]GHD38699.1 alpha/beta hydrolase [Mycetocola manganoxydans]